MCCDPILSMDCNSLPTLHLKLPTLNCLASRLPGYARIMQLPEKVIIHHGACECLIFCQCVFLLAVQLDKLFTVAVIQPDVVADDKIDLILEKVNVFCVKHLM